MTTPGPVTGVPIGVYRGSSIDITPIQEYEAFLGLPVGTVADYVLAYMADNPTWPQFEAAILAATTNGAAGTMSAIDWAPVLGDRKLVLSVPACCAGTTWTDEAAGKNDAHWATLTAKLVNAGLGGCLLRIGREFNASWYRWKATPANATVYSKGYAHVCNVVRGAGFTGQFIWNAYAGLGNFTSFAQIQALYPTVGAGNFGLDFYDGPSASYPPGEVIRTAAQQQSAWGALLSGPGGLKDWEAFATNKSRTIGYPEWGLRLWNDGHTYEGGGDNPVLVNEFAAWVKDTQPFMHAFWEDPGEGVSDPDWLWRRTVSVPNARKAFLAQFGYTAS